MPKARQFTIDFVVQDQWGVKGRNLLLTLAMYLGGVGGGLYLVSLLIGLLHGALLGVLIVGAGKGVAHILFLGRPERFWRAVRRPQASWISRGVLFLVVFAVSGLTYVLPQYPAFGWLPWSHDGWLGWVAYWFSVLTAILTMTYSGLLMTRSAIPFWNNSLLPGLFGVISLYSGSSLAGLLGSLFPPEASSVEFLRHFQNWSGVTTLALLFLYLWAGYGSNLARDRAVQWLALDGSTAWLFYGAFVGVGLAAPLLVSFAGSLETIRIPDVVVLGAHIVEVVVGGLLFRYLFFRAGVFLPVYL